MRARLQTSVLGVMLSLCHRCRRTNNNIQYHFANERRQRLSSSARAWFFRRPSLLACVLRRLYLYLYRPCFFCVIVCVCLAFLPSAFALTARRPARPVDGCVFFRQVTIVHRRAGFRSSKIMLQRVEDHPKISLKLHRTVKR